MSKQNSLFERFESFLITATLAAYASSQGAAFRQRDVRFYVELFSNWVETAFSDYCLKISNTQIQRYLKQLSEQGYVKLNNTKSPAYRLTRVGIVELSSRLVQKNYFNEREQLLFIVYFISNYKKRIITLIENDNPKLPPAFKFDLERILDHKNLLQSEIKYVVHQLHKLEERIDDAVKTADYTSKALRKNLDFIEIASEVERLYPYEFNSQKPLGKLLMQLDVDQRQWEIEKGTLRRTSQLWLPQKRMLELYKRQLEDLLQE